MGSFLNADGLYLKYGTSSTPTTVPNEGVSLSHAGQYANQANNDAVVEILLDLTKLTETESVQNDVAIIPDNSLLTKVEVTTIVAAATGTAIDLGLVHISRNTADAEFTADPDGLLSAFLTASMDTVGQYVWFVESGTEDTAVVFGTTTAAEGGDLIGDIIAAPTLITCSRTTATAFTAGKIRVRITYLQNPTLDFVS